MIAEIICFFLLLAAFMIIEGVAGCAVEYNRLVALSDDELITEVDHGH